MQWGDLPPPPPSQDSVQRVVECSHLRVIGGAQFPSGAPYSAEFVDFIESMLAVDPLKRPFVPQLIERCEELLKRKHVVG